MNWYKESKRPQIPKKYTGGDCFEISARYVMDNQFNNKSKDLYLVHGEVTGQGAIQGIKYGHAWIEEGDTVIDKSNGRNLRFPKVIYYALGQIEKTIKYTPEELSKKIQEHKHWGPWDLITEY